MAGACTGSSVKLEEPQCAGWIAFHDATGGKSWRVCSGARTDPCSCAPGGVRICDLNGTVVKAVELAGANLAGTLPSAIGAWRNLTFFSVHDNKLSEEAQQHKISASHKGEHESEHG